MSLIALPTTWRFAVFNGMQSSISTAPVGMPTVNGVRVRFDSAGSAIFDTNTTFFSTAQASIGANSYVVGPTFSNVSGWLGLDGLFSAFASGGLSGTLQLYLEGSTDGGTTWPTPASANGAGGGFLIAGIGFGSTTTNTTASTTRRIGFNL